MSSATLHSSHGVRAMVMAAGAGTRLRPLTDHVPKPMVPIANRPVLEYALLNLKRHGIIDIILNLHSFPDQIKNYFGDGSRWGLRLRYSHEPRLLGTAGGVKNAEAFLNKGTFIVMSGDGLTDTDLTALIAFHRARRSIATMAVAPVDVRLDYGITVTTKAGRIARFVEKPSWSEIFSNQVNSGIYVFEPEVFAFISKTRPDDFGKHVWPLLLKRRKPIFAWETAAYWCDVGNLSEYRRAQKEFLEKKLYFRPHISEIKAGIWAPRSMSLKGVDLKAPCLIGENARIAPGVTIGAGTVIGEGARIDKNAHLEHTVLWKNAHVGENIALTNCIVTQDVRVSSKNCVFDGAIITKNDTLLA